MIDPARSRGSLSMTSTRIVTHVKTYYLALARVFDQSECTEVKPKCLNAVFDELFIINKRGLDKEDFEEEMLRIEVKDVDALTSDDLIGVYVVDLSWIYFKKNHEIYRTWVGLVNDEDPESNAGIQGRLSPASPLLISYVLRTTVDCSSLSDLSDYPYRLPQNVRPDRRP